MKTLCISLIIVALLILAVQIITEIIKSVFKDKENIIYNLIVFGVSLFLTLVTVIAASQIVPFKLVWYIIVGAIVARSSLLMALCTDMISFLKECLNL